MYLESYIINSISSRPLDEGGGGVGASLPPKFFQPFGPQFGLKIVGGGGSPSPGSATAFSCLREEKYTRNTQRKNPSLQRRELTQTQPTTQATFVGDECFQLCGTPL